MKKTLSYFFLILSFTLLTACGGGGGGSPAVVAAVVGGGGGNAFQGPFVAGSTVTAYQLNDDGTRSATSVTTTTTGNVGTYSFGNISWSGATELEITGFYFDENTGLTNNQETLNAIVNMVAGTGFSANINIFTHLEAKRIKALMASNSSLADAKASAQATIKALFNLNLPVGTDLTDLDLTEGSGDNAQDNAELLRISAAIAANTSLLPDLVTAIEDGNIQNDSAGSSALASLVQAAAAIDLNAVATRLETLSGITDAPNVADVNSNNAPAITAISDQAKDEDAAAFNITLEVTDADSADTPSFTSAFSSDPTKATVSLSGSTLTVTPVANASGSTLITVNATDGNLPTAKSFTVNLTAVNDAPILADIADATKTYGDASFDVALSATDVENDSLSFSASSSNAGATVTVSGSTLTVTPVSAGTAIITVTVDDGTTTTNTTMTLVTSQASQTIEAGDAKSVVFGSGSFTQAATGTSGTGAVTYASSDTAVATVDSASGAVTIVAVGTSTITASIVADTNYAAATDTYVLTVAKASIPNISIANVTKIIADSDFEPAATGGNAGAIVATASSDMTVATIINGQVHIVASGTTTITAHESGNANYNDSADATFTLDVTNIDPVANAGSDQSIILGASATLDGSLSSDSGGSIASYVWSFGGQNIGSGETLVVTTGTAGAPQFPVGAHTITLTVTDNLGTTHVDTMTLTVSPPAPTNLIGTTGDHSAQLSWDAVAGATNYDVYLAAETFNGDVNGYAALSGGQTIAAGADTSLPIPSPNLPNGTELFFVVTATSNGIESAPSNEKTGTPNPVAGNLVDPYIVGAVMYQDSNDDGVWSAPEPKSTATTANGAYSFDSPLTPGAKIRIFSQGTHEGKAYDVPLTGLVDAEGNVDVVTPLTTLTSRGLTKQQLADILNHAALQNIYDDPEGHPEDINHAHNGHFISAGTPIVVGGATWSITAAEIDLNPLAGNLLSTSFDDIIGDNAKQRELIKLQASITIAALIKIFEGSDALKEFDGTDLYENGFPHNDAAHPLGADVAGSAFFDGNGHVAVLARNILKGVTDSLSLAILGNVEDSLAPLRNGLIAGSGGSLDATSVLTVAPKVDFDLTSKVAVTFVERLAEVGFTACNSQTTDDDGNGDVADDKIRAALEAVGTTQGVISSVVFGDLAPKLYGMKHQTTLEPYRAAISAAGGTTLIAGMDAKIASNVTFRFNGSNQLVAQ